MFSLRLMYSKAIGGPSKCLMTLVKNVNTDRNITEWKIEKLKERSILEISGRDALQFLQDLVTNDVNLLLKDKQSVYSMFLNSRGRVIHDALIYKSPKGENFLLESDTCSTDALKIHLSMYQTNKEISVESKEYHYSVWSIFNPEITEKPITTSVKNPEVNNSNNLKFLEEINFGDEVIICYDPRILSLGIRVVAPTELDIINLIKVSGFHIDRARPGEFKLLRYKLGIGEGINEILYGRYHPYELNCDYLNALCNKKESYLGANFVKEISDIETDNRIMPIKLLSNRNNTFPLNTPVLDLGRRKRTPLGYLRGIQGLFGIALVRVSNSSDEREVIIGNTLAHCVKPTWWPEISQNIPAKRNISIA